MQVRSCTHVQHTQTELQHHKPTDIKSTCQCGPQVCDPVWNIFLYTTTAGSNLLVDLNTVHLTCHALYMCCVNVHVSLYILCCPNWHAAGPSSCEAFCACVRVCVSKALSKAPASSRPPGHNSLQLPPSRSTQEAARVESQASFFL